MVANPYTADAAGSPNPLPPTAMLAAQSAYAVPSLAGRGDLNDPLGWSPSLRTESNGVPDAERVGLAPIRQRSPDARRPPEEWYDAYTDYDDARRHAVESVDANGFPELRNHEFKRAPDPRWNPPAPSRVTAAMHPRTYAFWRPFQRPPARNNGMHFSMADHRRTYPVLGMAPTQQRRNTHRLDPTPWDVNMYDDTVSAEPLTTEARVVGPNVPPMHGGAFRAGG